MTQENVLGSVIHGTHRSQDLIPRFLDTLHDIAAGKRGPGYDIKHASAKEVAHLNAVPAHVQDYGDDHPWWDSEEASFIVSELMDDLDNCAPEGSYFGANEGDGSDFGFWNDEQSFDAWRGLS